MYEFKGYKLKLFHNFRITHATVLLMLLFHNFRITHATALEACF